MDFVGRERERAFLERAWKSGKSHLIPVYGRRRVGKTALLAKFVEGKKASLYYAGHRIPREQQLAMFMRVAAEALKEPLLAQVHPADWKSALESVVERWTVRGRDEPCVLVLDEFQWIAETAPEVVSAIQQLWDHSWQGRGRFVLILCGSLVGFMEREVLGRQSPLFGRRTGTIRLQPLPPNEARKLNPDLGLDDAARLYFLCGGIPAYHLVFSSTRSIAQNIAEAFFEPGALAHEPTFLIREELREIANYQGVLQAIARGVTERKAIAKTVGLSPSNLSFYLDQLVDLGYVRRKYPLTTGRPATRLVRFVLSDPLLRFWFRFIEETERHAALVGPLEAVSSRIVPELEAYFGLCFEDLCRQALPALYVREGVESTFEVGEYWSKAVQVDVVGVRKDGVIDLGECKWGSVRSKRALADELEAKLRAYPAPTGTTLVRRAFVRRRPRGRADDRVLWHTLEDLYEAFESTR